MTTDRTIKQACIKLSSELIDMLIERESNKTTSWEYPMGSRHFFISSIRKEEYMTEEEFDDMMWIANSANEKEYFDLYNYYNMLVLEEQGITLDNSEQAK